MSNLLINIRFWYWHLQLSNNYRVTWSKNVWLYKKGLDGYKKIELL